MTSLTTNTTANRTSPPPNPILRKMQPAPKTQSMLLNHHPRNIATSLAAIASLLVPSRNPESARWMLMMTTTCWRILSCTGSVEVYVTSSSNPDLH